MNGFTEPEVITEVTDGIEDKKESVREDDENIREKNEFRSIYAVVSYRNFKHINYVN